MPNSRVFLDIDIDSRREKYARAAAFVEATDLRYGFSSKDIAELGGGEKQRVLECYQDDFDWSGKGPIEIEPAFWRRFRDRCRAEKESCVTVGELFGVKPDDVGEDGHFDSLMNYAFGTCAVGFVGGGVIWSVICCAGAGAATSNAIGSTPSGSRACRLATSTSNDDPAVDRRARPCPSTGTGTGTGT